MGQWVPLYSFEWGLPTQHRREIPPAVRCLWFNTPSMMFATCESPNDLGKVPWCWFMNLRRLDVGDKQVRPRVLLHIIYILYNPRTHLTLTFWLQTRVTRVLGTFTVCTKVLCFRCSWEAIRRSLKREFYSNTYGSLPQDMHFDEARVQFGFLASCCIMNF